MPKIVSIVEGDGERAAVPILIRRIAETLDVYDVHGYATVLTKRNRFLRIAHERERAMQAARSELNDGGAILILLDSDGEPPCTDPRHRSSPCKLGAELLSAVAPLAAGVPVAVVMAEREYEAWFVAAASSLVGAKGLPDGVVAPENPDQIRDPKGWLTTHMAGPGQAYDPTAD